MQKVIDVMKKRSKELLKDGVVNRVLAWQTGEFVYDQTPAVFTSEQEIEENMVYDAFSAPNLSKYMIEESKKDGKILVFLKPCDTYSFNQLIKEHRVKRDKVYIVGIECNGKADINKIKEKGITGISSIEETDDELICNTVYGVQKVKIEDILLEKCVNCKGKEHKIYDELIVVNPIKEPSGNRFKEIEEIENMTAEERFAFWQNELSKCIRCNACRNVCPACSCLKCVFDNPESGVEGKSNPDSFEEQLFHIIRAYHVAGRCTDCGECSRVCPQGIPLHLLNRKFIKDLNEFYGDYQAGDDTETRPPLVNFTKEDMEPNAISDKGGNE